MNIVVYGGGGYEVLWAIKMFCHGAGLGMGGEGLITRLPAVFTLEADGPGFM